MKFSFENNLWEQEKEEKDPVLEISKNNFEYLKPGVPHILCCVGSPAQFMKTEKNRSEFYEFYDSRNDVPEGYDIVDINYDKSHEELEMAGFKNPKTYSYVISQIDNFSKISKNYFNCIGFLAVGYKKGTKENISFMSHQNPRYFLKREEQYKSFIKDFESSLNELKEICEEKTMDAIIFGGNYYKKNNIKDDDGKMKKIAKKVNNLKNIHFETDFVRSSRLFDNETKKILGFEPTIITKPKTEVGPDNVYFDNKNRRLYFSRLKIDSTSMESFLPTELEGYLKKI
jgi:hypothetical protein